MALIQPTDKNGATLSRGMQVLVPRGTRYHYGDHGPGRGSDYGEQVVTKDFTITVNNVFTGSEATDSWSGSSPQIEWVYNEDTRFWHRCDSREVIMVVSPALSAT